MRNEAKSSDRISRLLIAGLLAALAVALNYAMISIPQVKFSNLIIFIAGIYGGIYAGILSGSVFALVYFTFNPYGMPPLPLLAAQVGCMALIGAAGGICGRYNIFAGRKLWISARAAAAGFILALIYNLVTTAVGAFLFGAFKQAFIGGAVFMLVNVGVNVVIFAVLIPVLLPVIDKLRG